MEGNTASPENREYIANTYVMRCFTVTMLVYLATFLLNLIGVFTIEQELMWYAFLPSVLMYGILKLVVRGESLSERRTKYYILFSIIVVFTISGVFLTYHVILISMLPFLYAVLAYTTVPPGI